MAAFIVVNPEAMFMTACAVEIGHHVAMDGLTRRAVLPQRVEADIKFGGCTRASDARTHEDAAAELAPLGDFKPYHVLVIGQDSSKIVRVEPTARAKGVVVR